jgi:glycosyltransferase involved in cell wall biosynthesis
LAERKLITVAIPTYLRDEYLRDALESVFSQTLTDLEIIVSDNANSSTTRALVESYRDRRVTYAPLRDNIGSHGNMTRCLHLGSAPYIAVLLDDDTMYPTNLETKAALLDEYQTAGVAHSAFDYIDQAGRVTDRNITWTASPRTARLETGREFIQRSMATGNRIATSSAVVRRSAVKGLCHDRRDGGFSDLGLWLRIAVGYDIAFSNESLTTVRLHAGSISSELGLHESGGDDVSLATFPMTSASRSAKFRFIEEYDVSARERSALERLVKQGARTELTQMIAANTLGTRQFSLAARQLYRATRIEPSLLWSPWPYIILISSVLGRRVFDTAVVLRSRL